MLLLGITSCAIDELNQDQAIQPAAALPVDAVQETEAEEPIADDVYICTSGRVYAFMPHPASVAYKKVLTKEKVFIKPWL